jgi:hypothetical protein
MHAAGERSYRIGDLLLNRRIGLLALPSFDQRVDVPLESGRQSRRSFWAGC